MLGEELIVDVRSDVVMTALVGVMFDVENTVGYDSASAVPISYDVPVDVLTDMAICERVVWSNN